MVSDCYTLGQWNFGSPLESLYKLESDSPSSKQFRFNKPEAEPRHLHIKWALRWFWSGWSWNHTLKNSALRPVWSITNHRLSYYTSVLLELGFPGRQSQEAVFTHLLFQKWISSCYEQDDHHVSCISDTRGQIFWVMAFQYIGIDLHSSSLHPNPSVLWFLVVTFTWITFELVLPFWTLRLLIYLTLGGQTLWAGHFHQRSSGSNRWHEPGLGGHLFHACCAYMIMKPYRPT